MNEKIEVIIVVEGGVIQTVATPKKELAYRIIDLDSDNLEKPVLVGDYEADEVGVKVAEFTNRFTNE